ncbi:hypothetical protein TSOC_013897, partial [Tetrabaena socialis]
MTWNGHGSYAHKGGRGKAAREEVGDLFGDDEEEAVVGTEEEAVEEDYEEARGERGREQARQGVPIFPIVFPGDFSPQPVVAVVNQARRRLAKKPSPGAGNSTSGDGEPENFNGPASDLLAALMDGYDRTAFPQTDDGGPVKVEINVAMHKILSINLQEGSMDLNVWF